MRLEHDDTNGPREDLVTRMLRATYAPPSDEGYWDSLEARIMARISAARSLPVEEMWWSVLERWGRAGLVAAGILLLIAGLAIRQGGEAETTPAVAYEEVLGVPPTMPTARFATQTSARQAREATLEYFLTQ